MIIHHSSLKKNKKNEISASLNRGKRNAHRLSSNAKMANSFKFIFVIFAMIAICISLIIMSYNLIAPKIERVQEEKKLSPKTELKEGEYLMIYNPQKGKFEYAN